MFVLNSLKVAKSPGLPYTKDMSEETAAAPASVNLTREMSRTITDHFPFEEIRPVQEQALKLVSHWLLGPKKFCILEIPTGGGKCFCLDTLVLMYDGTIKKVQDVRIGDLLMGNDSTPRRVLSLSHGFDEMYDVVPIKGDKYTVNSQHILSLKFTGGTKTKGIYTKSQVPQFRKLGIKAVSNTVADIPLEDYRSLSKTQKHLLKGFRTEVSFPWQPTTVDPYFLGLWLGDGTSDRPEVTSSDVEISGFLSGYASVLGLEVNSYFHNNAYTFSLTTGERGGDPKSRKKNPLLSMLRDLDLLNNKHIPQSYKCNSRETRMRVFAGLIDSDGHHIVHGGYGFIFKIKQLAEDVAYLCRSLGFAAYMKPCKKTCTNAKDGPVVGKYWRISVSSGVGIESIPSILQRKQSPPRQQKKDPLVTGIKVLPAGRGEYFGFFVDGNGRFLLGDFTVVHNSGIGIAAGSYAKTLPTYGAYEPGAYYLSPQKVLTEQLMGDFEKNGLVELRGQANYYCPEFDMDCESASLVFEDMHNHETCHGYKPAKARFIGSPLSVTNFAYYLAETTTAHQLPDRTLLILDEAHGTEDLILGFTDTNITQKKCDEHEAGRLPLFHEGDTAHVCEWLNNIFVPATQVKYRQYRTDLQKARDAGDSEQKSKVAKKINATDKFLSRIALFTNAEQPEEWFAYSDWDENKKRGTGDLIIKPLTARLFADQILFCKASKILIMSATILDFETFMRNLGIDPADAEVLAMDSEFPVENRPIFFDEVGDMSYKNIDRTLPLMAKKVEALMTRYGKYKGLVHCQSFRTNKYLVDYLGTTAQADRVLTHSSGVKGSREAAVEQHYADMDSPTVLFSPSMSEGLDLKEDLARFCIVVKIPFAPLTPYIRARMQKDPDWYQWLAGLKLIQMTGRVVRSKTDKAHIWILDAGFRSFLARNRRKLSRWWVDSIIDMKKL